jgi:hypothetical protein
VRRIFITVDQPSSGYEDITQGPGVGPLPTSEADAPIEPVDGFLNPFQWICHVRAPFEPQVDNLTSPHGWVIPWQASVWFAGAWWLTIVLSVTQIVGQWWGKLLWVSVGTPVTSMLEASGA